MDSSSMDEHSDLHQDNQNTNSNEACADSACILSEENGLPEKPITEWAEKLQNAMQIPVIIVSSPPENHEEEVEIEETAHIEGISVSETPAQQSSMEDLLDEESPMDGKNGMDTASDDDFEVICRCSSIPLSLDTNDSRSTSMSSSNKKRLSSHNDMGDMKMRDSTEEEGDFTQRHQSPGQTPSVMYVPSQCSSSTQQSNSSRNNRSQDCDAAAEQQDVSAAAQPAGPRNVSGSSNSFSQQIPVYNVNGTTVTYVSGPQAGSGTPFSYPPEGGCQVQIPNEMSSSSFPGSKDQATGEGGLQAGSGGTAGEEDGDACHFVYPSIYVSSAGLISVLLRHDMSVEMTVDRTIRVVSHQHMMAVATDSRGTSACLYHPALKVIQQGTTTDISADAVRVHMGHDDVAFAVGHSRYRFHAYDVQPATQVKFSDIFKDQSVNLLFSSEGYGESLVPQCLEVASKAEYANLPKGGVIVRINGVKVTQTGNGDVTVVTGAKFIRLSPSFGMTRLGNRFIDIEIERDWSCRVSRGPHCFLGGDGRVLISNGKLEVEVNDQGRMKVAHLQPRRADTPQQCLRQSHSYVRRVNSVTYTASSAARAAAAQAAANAARLPPIRRRSAPVGVSL